MGQATVRGGFDTWAGSGAPDRTHGGDRYLALDSGSQYAFVYLKSPVPRGSTVASAKLRVRSRGSTGSHALTLRRVATSWKASTLTWTNKPGVTGTSKTASPGALSDGEVIEFDVTAHLQTIANGAANYGWRITTDSTSTHKLYGFDAGVNMPTLTVEWYDKPSKPTNLVPSLGVVSVAQPVLQFDYSDLSGDELVAVRVLIDPASNLTAPAWDSGAVSTSVPELDLRTTSYPGIADGATTKWCVQVQDAGGLWSNWSDWATLARVNKGTVTLDNPAAAPNNYVTETTPPIMWTFTATGLTQTAYRVRITDASDRTLIRYDSGIVTSPTSAHDLPETWKGQRILVDDRTYSVSVDVWDSVERDPTPDDDPWVRVWRDFTMDDDLTVPAPVLTAAQEGVTPFVLLSWTRATAPDAFEVRRKLSGTSGRGKTIATVDPNDVFVSGTTYQWRDSTAAPQKSHDYTVHAIVNRVTGGASNTGTVVLEPNGVWLLDAGRKLSVLILGQESGSWAMTDEAATYNPIGGGGAVRIVTGMRGLEGSLSGTIADAYGRLMADEEDALLSIKERPSRVYRLIASDVSIPVYVGDITIAPTPLARSDNPLKAVSFSFWQSGELPFEVTF